MILMYRGTYSHSDTHHKHDEKFSDVKNGRDSERVFSERCQ